MYISISIYITPFYFRVVGGSPLYTMNFIHTLLAFFSLIRFSLFRIRALLLPSNSLGCITLFSSFSSSYSSFSSFSISLFFLLFSLTARRFSEVQGSSRLTRVSMDFCHVVDLHLYVCTDSSIDPQSLYLQSIYLQSAYLSTYLESISIYLQSISLYTFNLSIFNGSLSPSTLETAVGSSSHMKRLFLFRRWNFKWIPKSLSPDTPHHHHRGTTLQATSPRS